MMHSLAVVMGCLCTLILIFFHYQWIHCHSVCRLSHFVLIFVLIKLPTPIATAEHDKCDNLIHHLFLILLELDVLCDIVHCCCPLRRA